MSRPHYDVVCVGAGPAGATLGFYMSKMGRKILLLEKATFPRDKICGDALCKTGIEIIHEMGVYEELKKENKMNIVSCYYFSSYKILQNLFQHQQKALRVEIRSIITLIIVQPSTLLIV